GDDRDEGGQQRVFDEILPAVVADHLCKHSFHTGRSLLELNFMPDRSVGSPACGIANYEEAPGMLLTWELMLSYTLFTPVPTFVIAVTATNEMNPASSAYSIRS